MWLVFVFFILILTGIIFSNVNIIFSKININEKEIDFDVKISLFWFGIIKIISININRNYIIILGKKIKYDKIISKEKINKLKQNSELINHKEILNFIRDLEPKLIKSKFSLKIGVKDVYLTVILVVIFSSIITVFLEKIKADKKIINYEVMPEFNKALMVFEGKLQIKIKLKSIISIFYKNFVRKKLFNKKLKIAKNYISIEN